MNKLTKLLKKKGFYKWFDEYSQKHHGLKGWLENDIYLDEVELPVELFNTLIVEWLKTNYNIWINVSTCMEIKSDWRELIDDTFSFMYTIGYSDEKLYKENYNKSLIWKKGYKSPQETYSAGIEYVLKELI